MESEHQGGDNTHCQVPLGSRDLQGSEMGDRWVDITFDCVPLRSIGRLDIPLDASPRYRGLCESIKAALAKHGSHNSYYLHHASCTYHLANSQHIGMIQFQFEGTVLTDEEDLRCERRDLDVRLVRETCDWLIEPVVDWLTETVARSVAVEFDRYIAAGDLDRAKQRMEKIRAASDEAGGFLGMYL